MSSCLLRELFNHFLRIAASPPLKLKGVREKVCIHFDSGISNAKSLDECVAKCVTNFRRTKQKGSGEVCATNVLSLVFDTIFDVKKNLIVLGENS